MCLWFIMFALFPSSTGQNECDFEDQTALHILHFPTFVAHDSGFLAKDEFTMVFNVPNIYVTETIRFTGATSNNSEYPGTKWSVDSSDSCYNVYTYSCEWSQFELKSESGIESTEDSGFYHHTFTVEFQNKEQLTLSFRGDSSSEIVDREIISRIPLSIEILKIVALGLVLNPQNSPADVLVNAKHDIEIDPRGQILGKYHTKVHLNIRTFLMEEMYIFDGSTPQLVISPETDFYNDDYEVTLTSDCPRTASTSCIQSWRVIVYSENSCQVLGLVQLNLHLSCKTPQDCLLRGHDTVQIDVALETPQVCALASPDDTTKTATLKTYEGHEFITAETNFQLGGFCYFEVIFPADQTSVESSFLSSVSVIVGDTKTPIYDAFSERPALEPSLLFDDSLDAAEPNKKFSFKLSGSLFSATLEGVDARIEVVLEVQSEDPRSVRLLHEINVLGSTDTISVATFMTVYPCEDDQRWESLFGFCESYRDGRANNEFCDSDIGGSNQVARRACPNACGACTVSIVKDEILTSAPTEHAHRRFSPDTPSDTGTGSSFDSGTDNSRITHFTSDESTVSENQEHVHDADS